MRLIDADAIISFVDVGHLRNPLELAWSDNDVVDMIESRPTIDAVPVVHGEWEHKPNTYICECTACRKYWIPYGDEYDYHYCPNCGAKMKTVTDCHTLEGGERC